MVEITLPMIAFVCVMVFIASFIDSIAGGGGLISLPAYMAIGLPTAYAAGTNKMTACAGTLIAAVRFAKNRQLIWRVAILAALGALPGAYIGASIMQMLPSNTSRIMMLVIIPLAAAAILLRDKLPRPHMEEVKHPEIVALAIGLCVGFYDGLVGPGTGTFLIVLFTALLGLDDVRASGCAKIVNLASNISALSSMLLGGHVLFTLGLPAMCCSIIGGYLGSGMAMKRGAKFVRIMMLVVLALLLTKLAWDTFA